MKPGTAQFQSVVDEKWLVEVERAMADVAGATAGIDPPDYFVVATRGCALGKGLPGVTHVMGRSPNMAIRECARCCP